MRCSIKEGVLVLLQNTPFPVLTHKCGQLDTRNERGVASDVATTGLRENTRLLHFAVKLFQCYIKWAIRVYNDLGHRRYQRDLLVLARRVSRG